MKSTCVAAAIFVSVAVSSGATLAAPDITIKKFPMGTATQGAIWTQDPTVSISADGRYVAYFHQQIGSSGYASILYVLDVETGTKVIASKTLSGASSGSSCSTPSISANGRYVAFNCNAASMGAVTLGGIAYFVYDRLTDKTEMVPDTGNAKAGQNYGVGITPDGRYIAFQTYGTDARIFVRDMVNKVTTATPVKFLEQPPNGRQLHISADARYISFTGKTVSTGSSINASVYDRLSGTTTALDVRPDGTRSTSNVTALTMSENGQVFSFVTTDPNLTVPGTTPGYAGVYLRSSVSQPELLSGVGNYHATGGVVSGNGRYVAYYSNGLYVYDRLTKLSRNVVLSDMTIKGVPRFSSDGRYLAFAGENNATRTTILVADLGVEAGFALSANTLALAEGGEAGTYTLALTQVPSADVKITIGAGTQLGVARSELVFTPLNWNIPQVVSVRALADAVTEGTHHATIVHTVTSSDINYSVVQPADVTVTITDGVVPTLVLPGVTWSLPDMPVTGTAAPGATVIVSAYNRTTGWMSAASAVADAQGKWSHTVTGLTDGLVEIDAAADGAGTAVQAVTVKLASNPQQPAYTDVTGYIRYTAYGLTYVRSTGKYAGDFVITNTGSIKLTGPLHLVLSGLTPGVTLINATGTIAGAPYITVSGDLEPDGSITIPLLVDNPNKVGVGYEAKIYSGKL